jgi:hypothetical protein
MPPARHDAVTSPRRAGAFLQRVIGSPKFLRASRCLCEGASVSGGGF